MTAMVLFLLDSGVRVGEMLGLKRADLDLEQGRAKVMGKGAKDRYVSTLVKPRNALYDVT